MPGKTVRRQFYMRVVWVLGDEPGRIEAFEARLEFLRDLVREGWRTKGMPYGYLCGVKFEAGMKLENVRAIQQRFEREAAGRNERPSDG